MTKAEQRDLAIFQWLTGDRHYGRAIRECDCWDCQTDKFGATYGRVPEPCPNGGEVFREWLVCPSCWGDGETSNPKSEAEAHRQGDPWMALILCSECRGKGRIPNEAGRAVIAEAVDDWFRQGMDRRFSLNERRIEKNWSWLDVWITRHNQPWQSVIEAHVRTYQQPPPDLRANDGSELKRLLREAGWGYEMIYEPSDPYTTVARCCSSDDRYESDWTAGDTEADALYKAVEAAMETSQ